MENNIVRKDHVNCFIAPSLHAGEIPKIISQKWNNFF